MASALKPTCFQGMNPVNVCHLDSARWVVVVVTSAGGNAIPC